MSKVNRSRFWESHRGNLSIRFDLIENIKNKKGKKSYDRFFEEVLEDL